MRGASPAKDLELRQQRLCDYLVDLVSATDTAEPGVVKGESVYSRVERLLSSQSASASVPSSSTLSTSGLDVSSFINKRSTGNEVCALHLSVWKNDLKMVNLLLDYGADPDVADGESGWSSLHRACYFGYLGLVTRLLQAKASTKVEDRRGRTPFDLLSHEMTPLLRTTEGGEVFSWGVGTNYQLGTGCTDEQTIPTPIISWSGNTWRSESAATEEEVEGSFERIAQVSAAKYHSCAVTTSGQLLTWGFGRGGRLGHSDFHIHNGHVAVIEPRLVKGLCQLKVVQVAAAKHHTLCLIGASGDVYSWGSNKDGRLGYRAVDSQPTPRKVASIKQRIVQIAAANKHSVAVTALGGLLTWGCNAKGQLGYGTTDAGSNATPRIVEALRSGCVKKASASKNHTLVLTKESEVWTFGHKIVIPQRVIFSPGNSTSKKSGKRIEYHNDHTAIFRPDMVQLAAGAAHSTAISSLGVVYCWNSFDPSLSTFQVKLPDAALSVSASKERTLVCTCNGNVYAWEGSAKLCKHPETYKMSVDIMRTPNIRRVAAVSVGEKHSLAIQKIWFPPWRANGEQTLEQSCGTKPQSSTSEFGALSEFLPDYSDDDEEQANQKQPVHIPSLHEMCQVKIAEKCVNTRLLCPLIEFCQMFEAHWLKKYCQKMTVGNLDVVAAVRGSLQKDISMEEIKELENFLPQAAIVESAGKIDLDISRGSVATSSDSNIEGEARRLYQRSTSSLSATPRPLSDSSHTILENILKGNGSAAATPSPAHKNAFDFGISSMSVRSMRKKLQQIVHLEEKFDNGEILDEQQLQKIELKESLQDALVSLTSLSLDEIYARSPTNLHTLIDPALGLPTSEKKKTNSSAKIKKGKEASVVREPVGKERTPRGENLSSRRVFLEESPEASSLVDYNYTFPLPSNESLFPSLKEAGTKVKRIKGFEASPVSRKSKPRFATRKGNLSSFLGGDLDSPPKQKKNNFAQSTWQLPPSSSNDANVSSLKSIQQQQAEQQATGSAPAKFSWGGSPNVAGGSMKKLSLQDFFLKTGKQWSKDSVAQPQDLRAIQKEEEDLAIALAQSLDDPRVGSSPSGFGSSPGGSNSKWYLPDAAPVPALHDILQEEELQKVLAEERRCQEEALQQIVAEQKQKEKEGKKASARKAKRKPRKGAKQQKPQEQDAADKSSSKSANGKPKKKKTRSPRDKKKVPKDKENSFPKTGIKSEKVSMSVSQAGEKKRNVVP